MNGDSPVPKYRQIIDAITDAIDHRQLVEGDKIPSIVCSQLDLNF